VNEPDTLRLVVMHAGGERRHPLRAGQTRIGSAQDNDIVIVERTVSRRHAVIECVDGQCRLIDLASSNGSRVNGIAVTEDTALHPGDTLAFGFVEARLMRLDSKDAIVGIHATQPPGLSAVPGNVAAPTLMPHLAARFAFEHLPALLDRLAEGSGTAAFAAALGTALRQMHPCMDVLVVRTGQSRASQERAVLFHAQGSSENRFDAHSDGLRLELGADASLDEAALHQIGRIALALLRIAVTRTASPAPLTHPSRDATAPSAQPPTPLLDPAIRDLYAQAARVAGSDLPVLIQGESGTGKELLAQYIHAASTRACEALVALNCAALPRDLLELELFGIEEGVATGVKARAGKFELADQSTLFLDEIGELAPDAQAKLLRVLQEREVVRIGGHRARPARVRVISATHHDLRERVEQGSFRLDLYHRIAAWKVTLPPLRARPADLPALALHFLERACHPRGVRPTGISERALASLLAYDWPGNIRQLETEMARAALFLGDGDVLDSSLLHEDIRRATATASPPSATTSLEQHLILAERMAIEDALAACDHNATRAAQRLDVPRSTLYRRMAALGIRSEPSS